MKRKSLARTASLCMVTALLAGCGHPGRPSPKDPVTLTMWHNYGGDMQKTMDALIDEFNSTLGREQGIVINVTAISSSAELNESLDMIAAGDPGAPAMPDICTAYPKVAIQFQQTGRLANLDSYFSQEELSGYVPAFIEEGRLADGGLYVFPLAKSTEILYLNQTLFDRFAAETGAKQEQLATFEGIAALSKMYYDWTDAKTPDIPGDGKMFFTADSWFNVAQAGMKQLGSSLIEGETLNLSGETYAHIFATTYVPAVEGGIAIYDGYSSDLSKTGDLVCSTGSSAGILFYGDTITYPDNTVEQVAYSILPYPVFEGGTKTAIQRGGGLMVASNEEKKEYAAAVFIKWLTASEQNMRFISSTGYLPVTRQAFETDMDAHIASVEDARIKKMLVAVTSMYREYRFFTPPNFAAFDDIGKEYEKRFKTLLASRREAYLDGGDTGTETALAEIRK